MTAVDSASEVSAALVPRSAELAADIYRLIVKEIPFLLLIASASLSGSPGISGPLVPGAGLVFLKT